MIGTPMTVAGIRRPRSRGRTPGVPKAVTLVILGMSASSLYLDCSGSSLLRCLPNLEEVAPYG
jgi:hypothetical protein